MTFVGVESIEIGRSFSYGELDEEVFVEQPCGYVKKENECVYKSKKVIYELKQTPRAWYSYKEDCFIKEVIMSLLFSSWKNRKAKY